jgi:hypothetical protein
MLPQSTEWPFDDPPNVATHTTRQIVRDGRPILYVSHDEDDGAWQFHTGDAEVSLWDGMIVCLSEMVRSDPSLLALADLPYGWVAFRESVDSPWRRCRRTELDDDDNAA